MPTSPKKAFCFFSPDPCVCVCLKCRPYRMRTYRTVPVFTVALSRLKLFNTIFFFDYTKVLLDHFSKLVCKQMSLCAYFQQCLVLQSPCLCSKLCLWLTCIFFTSSDYCLICRPKHLILSYVKKKPVITYLSSKPVSTLNPSITSIYFKHCSYLQVFLVCFGEYFYAVDFWKKERPTLLSMFGLASLPRCGLKIFCNRLRVFYFT